MAENLVTRSTFATMAGVTRPSITLACRGVLAPAVVGRRIDADHPKSVAYLAKHAVTGDPLYPQAKSVCQTANKWSARFIARALGVGRRRATRLYRMLWNANTVPNMESRREPPPLPKRTISECVGQPPALPTFILDLPLRRAIAEHGTEERMGVWLKAAKELEVIADKRARNSNRADQMVSRQLVEETVSAVEKSHSFVMGPFAQALAADMNKEVSAGKTLPELERFVADAVGKALRAGKTEWGRRG